MQSTGMKVLLAVMGVGVLGVFAGIGHLAQFGTADVFGAGNGDLSSPRGNGTVRRAMGNQAPGLQERDPIPEDESAWADVDESAFRNKERLAERPGNFEVIKKVGEFFEACYQVQPVARDLSYPLFIESERIESKQEHDRREADRDRVAREAGIPRTNGWREGNFIIHKLTLCRFKQGEATITNPADHGLKEYEIDRFVEVRKLHPEPCYLVLVHLSYESFKGDKVSFNNNDSDMILCYVRKSDGWKLVWMDK